MSDKITDNPFAGLSRQELWRRAEAARQFAREAATVQERNRFERMALDYDMACDRAWRGGEN